MSNFTDIYQKLLAEGADEQLLNELILLERKANQHHWAAKLRSLADMMDNEYKDI